VNARALALVATLVATPVSANLLYEFAGSFTSWVAGDQFGNSIPVVCVATIDCTAHGRLVTDDAGRILSLAYSDATYDFDLTPVCYPDERPCDNVEVATAPGFYNFLWIRPDGATWDGGLLKFYFDAGRIKLGGGVLSIDCCDIGYAHSVRGFGDWTRVPEPTTLALVLVAFAIGIRRKP
jgi:hypothetical protein